MKCPFCNNEEHVTVTDTQERPPQMWCAEVCTSCGARGPAIYVGKHGYSPLGAAKAASDAWDIRKGESK